jgi:hypothetical protein
MTLILMTNQSLKAYTDNYIWLIATYEDNLLYARIEAHLIERR